MTSFWPKATRNSRGSCPSTSGNRFALNYTSGTTGRPKGVVYHHRGAYLITMGTPISWRMTLHPTYLTIVPLFHCNNWCHVWTMPAVGGTTVCCRDITAKAIYDAIADEGVTHFGGAPIVLNMIVNAKDTERRAFDHTVEVFTAGAPPAAATLAAIETMGFNITQVYGLTETYGPATECTFKDGVWDGLQGADRAAVKARQGVAMPNMDHINGDGRRGHGPDPDGRHRAGRDHDARQFHDEGLLQEPARHERGLPGRLFPHRRHRRAASRQLHPDRRPRQGHHHIGAART